MGAKVRLTNIKPDFAANVWYRRGRKGGGQAGHRPVGWPA